MRLLTQIATTLTKLLVLGILVRVVLSWLRSPQFRKAEVFLDRIYEPALTGIRQFVDPLVRKLSPQLQVDLAPFLLILLIWWVLHPLLMWVFS